MLNDKFHLFLLNLKRAWWTLKAHAWAAGRTRTLLRLGAKMHTVKTWPQYYNPCVVGDKPFEVRLNDRDYKTGDVLVQQEFDPEKQEYTGEMAAFVVTYTLYGPAFGIEDGYCVMGLRRMG